LCTTQRSLLSVRILEAPSLHTLRKWADKLNCRNHAIALRTQSGRVQLCQESGVSADRIQLVVPPAPQLILAEQSLSQQCPEDVHELRVAIEGGRLEGLGCDLHSRRVGLVICVYLPSLLLLLFCPLPRTDVSRLFSFLRPLLPLQVFPGW